jgi:uncharacterized protein YneF (UPF0154 family)
MFYRLDGLSFASSILTPEQAASAPANEQPNQSSSNLNLAVAILSIVVGLLVFVGALYLVLRRMKSAVKVSPIIVQPQPHNFEMQQCRAGAASACARPSSRSL